MTLVVTHSTNAGARAPALARRLRSFHVVAAAGWRRLPAIRADRSFPVLMRSLAVGAVISAVAVLALTSQPSDYGRSAERVARARPRVAPTPFMTLSRVGDEEALDGDFSLEQAALTWAHRIIASNQNGEIDAAGKMRFGPIRVHRSIVERVVQAAKTTDTDPAMLMAIADKESSFSPRAKASTSSASGLFQFIDSTWLKAVRAFGWRHGHDVAAKAIEGDDAQPRVSGEKRARILSLRNDPYLSAVLAAEMLKKDGAKIAEKLGRALTIGETYLIHFLGPNDAERFMSKMAEAPDASAANLLPRPARANKPIFYTSSGGRLKERSVAEVHEAFENMMGARASRYQDVEAKLPSDAVAYADASAGGAAASVNDATPASAEEPAADRATRSKESGAKAGAEPQEKAAAPARRKAEARRHGKAVAAAKLAQRSGGRAARGRAAPAAVASRAPGGRVRVTLASRAPGKAAGAATSAGKAPAPASSAGVTLASHR